MDGGSRIWALGALFCGPLALVAYLIDRPKGVQTECGFCTRTVLESDQACPYCGRALDRIAAPRDRA